MSMDIRPTLVWSEAAPVPHLYDPRAADEGLAIAFTSRLGGRSRGPFESLNLSAAVGDDPDAVSANRALACSALGVEEGSMALARQVHGATTLSAATPSPEPVGAGDAMVTSRHGLAVGILSADCVPVLLAGTEKVAAVHAGWRGLVAGVIEAACAEVGEVAAAWVGPSIHACCYQVGPEVVEAFRDRSLPVADARRVDPGRAAIVALRRSGVARIATTIECTSCDERFFSHRRDGLTGRQGGFAAWL